MRKTKRKWFEWVVGHGVFLMLLASFGATHSMVHGISHSGRCYFGLVNIKQGVEWFIELLSVFFFSTEDGVVFLGGWDGGVLTKHCSEKRRSMNGHELGREEKRIKAKIILRYRPARPALLTITCLLASVESSDALRKLDTQLFLVGWSAS